MTARHPMPFYRSQITRVAFIVLGVAVGVGLAIPNQQWHSTPSLKLIHKFGLPWWAWASCFFLYSLLHLSGRPLGAIVGDWWGLFLGVLFLISLLVTTRWDRPANPVALGFFILALVLHYQAARLAHRDYDRRRTALRDDDRKG